MLCRVYWLIEFPGELHVAVPAAEIVQCVVDACCCAALTAFSTWETSPIATLTASWISRRSSASVVSSLCATPIFARSASAVAPSPLKEVIRA